jgi:spermidine/putrescine-binding protein
MPISPRHFFLLLALALAAGALSACGTINEKLADGMGDYIPQWLGGLPPDAPPRPGTAKYDEFMKERELKRLQPAPATPDGAKSDPAALQPIH